MTLSMTLRSHIKSRSPVRGLPPLAFIANNIYDLSTQLVLSGFSTLRVNQDIAASLDPDGVAELSWKLEKSLLSAWKRAEVEVASSRFHNAGDGLC